MLEMDIYHLMAMLDNTLQWARNQMQGIKVKKEEVNLYNLVNDVLLLYQQTSNSKNIRLVNSINPNHHVISDKEILNTVLRNIISNAIKFTPPGKNVYIQEADIGSKFLVQVTDEGVGIENDILEKIASNEFISTRGTENEKGTGLGILFSKELLKKLGEDFKISTEADKGTTVAFTITK
jgi:signal transduction histidine kinase